MDLTFRLPGPWGSGKGANLQPTEVDNNFWALAEAIVDLQSNPAQPVGIASISVSGTQMTITLTDGTVMGPFTLPVLTFRWRGEWAPFTAYAELDTFTVENTGIFMTLLDHTSGDTFDPDITVGGEPALQQLFGSVDATLVGLSDVEITGDDPDDGDFLTWDEALGKWIVIQLGTIAYQNAASVAISGGSITGLPTPVNPNDAATKAYVDSLPAGATAPEATIMANIAGSVAPAIPNTLTDILDYILAPVTHVVVRGTLLYRGGTGWIALAPGTAGLFLQTAGAGADPTWSVGASGVTSITAGSGISTGGAPITATGTVALAAVADNSLLANASGASSAPVATTLTAFLDHVLSNARGSVLTRAGGGWVALAPGTAGYYLKTQGSGADAVWDSPAGSGTVTSVSSGSGLTGGPITGSGTLALAAIANNSVLANISGGSAAPGAATPTLLFDTVFGATQGGVLYRNASTWVMLSPGTSGQILTTAGAAANPSWQNVPAGASVANLRIVSNVSGSTAAPIGNTITAVLDAMLGSSRGMIIYRGASGWSVLSPGTSGQLLQTGGAAGDPSWVAGSGGIDQLTGDVTAGPGSGSQAATLAATAVTPGSYTAANITVDAKGRITGAANGAAAGITQLTGDVTAGPGSGSQATTLANTAVTAGSYTNAAITVDAKGRLTAAATGSLPVNFIFSAGTVLANAEELARFIPPACSFPAGGAGSSGTAGAAATASTTLTVKKNGTAFATFVWAAAGTAATVTLSSTTTFNGTSDVLSMEGPATADTTLAKFGINLAGTRT